MSHQTQFGRRPLTGWWLRGCVAALVWCSGGVEGVCGWAADDDAAGPLDHQRDTVGIETGFQSHSVKEAVMEPAQQHQVPYLVGTAIVAVFEMV